MPKSAAISADSNSSIVALTFEFGRPRDDAFDFVRQLALSFLQAGLELGEESHRSVRFAINDLRKWRSRGRIAVAGTAALKVFHVLIRQFHRADERLALRSYRGNRATRHQ